MAPLIPEVAATLPSQFVASFWTLQAVINAYCGAQFLTWYKGRR
jgi:hypothetical protein